MKFVIIFFFFLVVISTQETTYYVNESGSDTATCGEETSPCASINQVITNYPGLSYIMSIAAGSYTTSQIILQNDAHVTFQGNGNPTIVTAWKSDSFIENSNFEFYDLTLQLTGGGSDFSSLSGSGNNVGFYNIALIYWPDYTNGNFIDMNSGLLTINNLTFNQATFDSYFIYDSTGDGEGSISRISIIGSTFSNLSIQKDGGFLYFDAIGHTIITVDSTSFNSISAGNIFIKIWSLDYNQIVTITNNVFNNTDTYEPSVLINNTWDCDTLIQNTTWNFAVSHVMGGAIGDINSDYSLDSNITLENLSFNNCVGNLSGAVYVESSWLILSNSYFNNNTGGYYANDLVIAYTRYTQVFNYTITNSYSSCALPKAIVVNLSNDDIQNISDLLPFPTRNVEIGHLNRTDVSASSKFRRK